MIMPYQSFHLELSLVQVTKTKLYSMLIVTLSIFNFCDISNNTYLWFNFLPDSQECFSSVDIFSVSHVRNIKKDHWFPINESIEDVLLKSRQVVFDVLALSNSEGIMTVGENDGLKLMLIVKKVTSVDVGDGDLVLPPDCR